MNCRRQYRPDPIGIEVSFAGMFLIMFLLLFLFFHYKMQTPNRCLLQTEVSYASCQLVTFTLRQVLFKLCNKILLVMMIFELFVNLCQDSYQSPRVGKYKGEENTDEEIGNFHMST